MSAELVIDSRSSLGECPLWDPEEQMLSFLDIAAHKLCRWRLGSASHSELAVADRVTAAAPCQHRNALVVGAGVGLGWLDRNHGQIQRIATLVDPSVAGMNDGAVDPYGRFWVGSSSVDRSRRDGKLWMLDEDLAVYPMLDGVGMSNGLGWLDNGRVLVHVDTLAGTVSAYDINEGRDGPRLGNQRIIVTVDESEGLPDGVAVDEASGIWLAVWGAGQIRRYTPDGAFDTAVTVDATQVTSCCFGGPHLTTLYITSARHGLTDPSPADGGVFAAAVGVAGMPTVPFAGQPNPIAK